MKLHTRPDEEPDVTTVDESWAGGVCERCGLAGHEAKRCPHVNILTYKMEP